MTACAVNHDVGLAGGCPNAGTVLCQRYCGKKQGCCRTPKKHNFHTRKCHSSPLSHLLYHHQLIWKLMR